LVASREEEGEECEGEEEEEARTAVVLEEDDARFIFLNFPRL